MSVLHYSAPVPKFLNPDPGPDIFQISESNYCQTLAKIETTENYQWFYLTNDHAESCCCRYWKVSPGSVSSEIFDLCKISDLLLFVSYFALHNNEIKFGNYFFDVNCVN